MIANRIRDEKAIQRSRVFPYQVMMAYNVIEPTDIPMVIKLAVQSALDLSLTNVPSLPMSTIIGVDVSGSMTSPVTGNRGSVTSKVECIDVAALVASAYLRKNPETVVMPFDTGLRQVSLNPYDSVATNTKRLRLNGGGTAVSVPLHEANAKKLKADLVFIISDNESWHDRSIFYRGSTALMEEWKTFKKRNPKAILVCMDITPNTTAQARGKDVYHIGGFSDSVFTFLAQVVGKKKNWVSMIEEISI